MKTISKTSVHAFLKACRSAADHGLMRCSSGNMSWRLDGKRMLASTTRSWMGRVTPDDVAVCSIEDGSVLNGRKPTVEISFHAGILRARPDINVVMHFQTPFATVMACRPPSRTNYFVIPEIPFYIGPIAHVPYFRPGTPELAEAVTDAMRTHDMVLMGNHGQVTVARDFDHVIQNAEFFELACEIIVRGEKTIRPLPAKDARELLDMRRRQPSAQA